jgi:signal transduction histidine kinase
MKAEDLKKLFRFFGTLENSKDINRGGMGLGLTISKMIINEFGGTIYSSSEYGIGSKFTFSIPI